MRTVSGCAYWARKLASFGAMLAVACLTLATSYEGQVHDSHLVGHSVLPAESSQQGVLLSVQSESFVSDVRVSVSPGATLHVVDSDGTLIEATGSLLGFCNSDGCEELELRILRAGIDGDLDVELVATVSVSDRGSARSPIVIELEFLE